MGSRLKPDFHISVNAPDSARAVTGVCTVDLPQMLPAVPVSDRSP